jgi:ribulose-5-phosphate 4-epimerase/fuculose-1-phosphate aldolase
VVLHTHQTWAMAMNMLQDNRLLPASQTAAFFHGQVAYDDDYTGLAATLEEGERLAAAMGTRPVVFMKNHGVLVVGDTVAQAYRRLYRLERVCRNQISRSARAGRWQCCPTRSPPACRRPTPATATRAPNASAFSSKP